MSTDARARARIAGRVQGVNFRWETKRTADRAGVRGWVRNRSDGTVEALFEGERGAVESVLAWCRQGPSHAKVSDVTVNWERCGGEEEGFEIRFA